MVWGALRNHSLKRCLPRSCLAASKCARNFSRTSRVERNRFVSDINFSENNVGKKVVVGISGGVDSSTSAYLLKQAGYEVIGMHMKNWDVTDELGMEECPAEAEYKDVEKVCNFLDIPVYRVNFVKQYWQDVFTPLVEGYENGLTPNPDVLCNQKIKFDAFLKKAKEIGADYVATGHYVRTVSEVDGESFANENHLRLVCGVDKKKDQSYFLSFVNRDSLKNVLFPLGNMHKSEVRKIAAEARLPTADKKDSYGICFIGKRNFRDFIDRYTFPKPGYFRNVENINEILGCHDSSVFYTIGQKAKISGAQHKWFVCDKDYFTNDIIVAKGGDHPSLYCDQIVMKTSNFYWVDNNKPPVALIKRNGEMVGSCRIRYRQSLTPCKFWLNGDNLHVRFDSPQYAATPGQICALYCSDGFECYGGGVIEGRGESYYEMGIELMPGEHLKK
eukprot:g8962.t1